MKPSIRPITKRSQGENDPSKPWSMARNLHAAQLLVQLGIIDSDHPDLEQFKVDGKFPPALKLEGKVRPIDEYSIAYWDESHKKYTIGDCTSRKKGNITVSFPVDKTVNLMLKKVNYQLLSKLLL